MRRGNPPDARLVPRLDSEGNNVEPVCVSGAGVARPAPRFVALARRVEADGGLAAVGSICEDDFAAALAPLTTALAASLSDLCFDRPLPRDEVGRADCELREARPPSGRCDARPGRVEADGPWCRVAQDPSGSAWGWRFVTTRGDEACPPGSAGRVRFSPGSEPEAGALLQLRCR